MIVLHHLRQQIPEIPVLFLDTGYHFNKPCSEYRDRIAQRMAKLHLHSTCFHNRPSRSRSRNSAFSTSLESYTMLPAAQESSR